MSLCDDFFAAFSPAADTEGPTEDRTASANAEDQDHQCASYTHTDDEDGGVFHSRCSFCKTFRIIRQTSLVDIIAVVVVIVVMSVGHVTIAEVRNTAR